MAKKSAPILTITSALAKLYDGISSTPNDCAFAFVIPEYETASYVTTLVVGYFAVKSAIAAFVDGLIIVDDKIRIAPPFEAIAANFPPISLSTDDHVAGAPLVNGPVKREESYKERMDA